MMDGQVRVQSSLGEGARFWVSMQVEIVQPAQASNIDLNGITVLLIDDCEKIVKFWGGICGMRGLECWLCLVA